jgi:hypothetical protein
MPRYYRALISVPITAENDNDADKQASTYARSLLHPGSTTIGGHLELLTEVVHGSLKPRRVVHEDPGFPDQLP